MKVAGKRRYPYWAIDQFAHVIDVLVAPNRDKRRFFTPALTAGTSPTEVTTDRASAYPRA